jgi:hypothetical protein
VQTLAEHSQKLSRFGEDLHSVILAVRDVEQPIRILHDAVRNVELAGRRALRSPRVHQDAIIREMVYARISITVRHENCAIVRDDGVGASTERLAAVGSGRPTWGSDCLQYPPIRSAPTHGVVPIIDAHQCAVPVGAKRMRTGEDVFTPTPDEAAVALEYNEGMVAPVEHIDPIIGAHGHPGDVLEEVTRGQVSPLPIGLKSESLAAV